MVGLDEGSRRAPRTPLRMGTRHLALPLVRTAPSLLWGRLRRFGRGSRTTGSPLSAGAVETVRIRLADGVGRGELREAGLHTYLLDECEAELGTAIRATRQ